MLQVLISTFRESIQILYSRTFLPYHALLCLTSVCLTIGFYSLIEFDRILLGQVFVPAPLHGYLLILISLVLYTSWIFYSTILSLVFQKPLEFTLKRDLISYLPLSFLILIVVKHVQLPITYFIISATTGFIILKMAFFIPQGTFLENFVKYKKTPILFCLILLYTISFSTLSSLRIYTFMGFDDFALFIQQIWGFGYAKALFLTHGGMYFFGGHVSPILFFLGPIYRLFENPITLPIIYSLVIALSAWPVFLIAHDKFQQVWIGLAFALVYLAYPATQLPNLGDFHETLIIPFFLLFGLYFIRTHRYLFATPFLLMTLFGKEDMAIVICMVGLFIFFMQRHRWVGSCWILTGLVWLWVSIKLIAPVFMTADYLYLDYYPVFGEFKDFSFSSFINMSYEVYITVFQIDKIKYIIDLLAPIGWIALLSPINLVMALPTLFEIILYHGPPFGNVANIGTWHVTILLPFILMATIDGSWFISRLSITHRALTWLTGSDSQFKQAEFLITSFICIHSILCNLAFGIFPFSFTDWLNRYEITEHVIVGHRIIDNIPSDASVSSSTGLAIYLSHRESSYTFPNPIKVASWFSKTAPPSFVDYVLVDTSHTYLSRLSTQGKVHFMDLVGSIKRDPNYHVRLSDNGYILFQKSNEN